MRDVGLLVVGFPDVQRRANSYQGIRTERYVKSIPGRADVVAVPRVCDSSRVEWQPAWVGLRRTTTGRGRQVSVPLGRTMDCSRAKRQLSKSRSFAAEMMGNLVIVVSLLSSGYVREGRGENG